MPKSPELSLDSAQQLISQGLLAAQEIGIQAVFAVLDAGAHLVAFARMDDSWLASLELAQAKARTSVMFRAPSEALTTPLELGTPMPHFDHLGEGLLLMGGGLPIFDAEGSLIGGLGVSGGTPEQDAQLAQLTLNARNAAKIE